MYVDRERSNMNGAGVWWLLIIGRLKPGATIEQARAQLEGVFHQSVVEHRTARQTQAQAQGGNPIKALEPKDFPRLTMESGSQGEMNTRHLRFAPAYAARRCRAGIADCVRQCGQSAAARAAARRKRSACGWRWREPPATRPAVVDGERDAGRIGRRARHSLRSRIKDGLLAVSDWGPKALEPRLDWRVLGFTLALSMLTGIVFGIVPAWRATKVDLAPSLKDNARGSSAASRSLLSRGLVVTQVALSLLLLIGAGLFLRTLLNLQRVEPSTRATCCSSAASSRA